MSLADARVFSRPHQPKDTIRTDHMFTRNILIVTLVGIGLLALLTGYKFLTGAADTSPVARVASGGTVLIAIAATAAILIAG